MALSSSLRVPLEVRKGKLGQPLTPRLALDTSPSYAKAVHGIHMVENFTVFLTVGAIQLGYSDVVSVTQGLSKIGNVTLNPTDGGQIMFTNITASISPNPYQPVIGFPTIQVVTRSSSNQAAPGTPPQGVLTPATSYGPISINVSVNLFAPAAYNGGTVTVNGTALLVGSSSSS